MEEWNIKMKTYIQVSQNSLAGNTVFLGGGSKNAQISLRGNPIFLRGGHRNPLRGTQEFLRGAKNLPVGPLKKKNTVKRLQNNFFETKAHFLTKYNS